MLTRIVTLRTFLLHNQDDRHILDWKQQPEKGQSLFPFLLPSDLRLERVTTDVAVHTVDLILQSHQVYNKSIKTTAIVREQGRQIVTVKVMCFALFALLLCVFMLLLSCGTHVLKGREAKRIVNYLIIEQ